MPEPPFVCVTVARQLGSGGSYLAQRVADRLGWPYLDRELLRQAAQELGVDAADLAPQEERLTRFWSQLLRAFALGAPESVYIPPPLQPVPDEQLLEVQQRVMCRLARQGHCVVVGRGGFHFLEGHARLFNVFVHAPRAWRRQRVEQLYNAQQADALLEQADRDREHYIRRATGRDWYDARNYHLCIDTARVGFEAAQQWIVDQAQRMVREGEGGSRGADDAKTETESG
ncbi:MAG TPA: cytidylate kinase-like family protein [Phycisphaeraceae bacterium]